MNLFRKALDTACHNEACRDGNLIYFGPADRFVPIVWVEKMAEHEWECSESGGCKHPSCQTDGCYRGQWAGEEWICEALLMDGNVVQVPFARIMQNLSA